MMRLFLTFIVTLGLVSSLFAHRVNIFCWVEGGQINCAGKFASGNKAQNCQVNVLDKKSGQVLASGKTNEQGEVSIPIPQKAIKEKLDLVVELIAGMGHRNTWPIPAQELLEEEVPENTEQVSNTDTSQTSQQLETKVQPEGVPGKNLDTANLEKVLNKVLDKKLKPVMEKLTLLQERPISFTDIFAGIGYIFGLMGIAMYFKAKGERQKAKG